MAPSLKCVRGEVSILSEAVMLLYGAALPGEGVREPRWRDSSLLWVPLPPWEVSDSSGSQPLTQEPGILGDAPARCPVP